MDKAEALAFVSRMFDTAAAGAVLWGDALLMKRFLRQCSRSGSAETASSAARRPKGRLRLLLCRTFD